MDEPVSNPYSSLEVDLEAIAANLASVRSVLEPGARVAAVVKADAYGHGLAPVARRVLEAGAEMLAVAAWPEGRALRQAGITAPILLLLGFEPDQAPEVVGWDLTPLASRLECFQALDAAARAVGKRAACHLKVDTGMGRLGVDHARAAAELEALWAMGGLRLTGITSHLATGGDPECRHCRDQGRLFADLLGALRAAGYPLPDSSLCNSGGALCSPWPGQAPAGLHRVGISLYGGLPHPAAAGRAELRTAMRLSSRLIEVRRVPAGGAVSYGRTWAAERDSILGAVPVGYADGYPRAASNRGHMLVRGRLVPIRGVVCMNLIMIDLTDLGDAPAPGEEVVLLGRQGEAEIKLDDLAGWSRTIGYEVACSLGRANPRVYI